MKKHLYQGILISSLIALAVTGCGQKPATNANQPTSTPESTPVVSATPAPTPDVKTSTVKVYFTDSNQSKLIEKEATVTYKPDETPYAATLNALKKSSDSSLASLFSGVTFKTVAFDKATGDLKLDLGFGSNSQLGAPGEDYFLQALKKTVFQFPEVKTLSVLKDGQKVDSLMGHMDLPYPIKRPN
jgi:Sporulation and spore germination